MNGYVDALQLFAQLLSNTVDRCQLEVENQYHMQCLAEAVVELADAERRFRFAMTSELHDGVAQFLAIARMRLKTLEGRMPDEALRRQVDPVTQLLDQAIAQIRQTMLNASPQWVTRAGLQEALRQAVVRMRSHCPTDFLLQCPEDLDITEENAVLIHQIIQELLFNVVKHAEAKQCRIRVRQSPEAINISVCDNGRGFETSRIWKRRGKLATSFGMLSLQLRVQAQHGSLRVFSRPGLGTCVRITLPTLVEGPLGGSRLLTRQEDADDNTADHTD